MNLVEPDEIEYPREVRVTRQTGVYDDAGNYTEEEITVIERMTADIQLSLKVRNLMSENDSGVSNNGVWIMYCVPEAPIMAGDRVQDGEKVYVVDTAGEWGCHTECVMREER